MKSKRSKAWGKRMYTNLVMHAAAADPDFAFEAAVLGEAAVQARYSHRALKRVINAAALAQRRAGGASAPVNPGHTTVYSPQVGGPPVHITLVGGGGGGATGPTGGAGGSNSSNHAADVLRYALGNSGRARRWLWYIP